jgi:glucokinase
MLLGFDIGGTKCAVVLAKEHNSELSIIGKEILPTDKPANEMLAKLFSTAEEILRQGQVSFDRLKGIGISCGGPLNSRTGTILCPPNLPGWNNIPVVSMAEEYFGCKALLQNDANAGALAEWKIGAAKGYKNIIFLTFGTGMGAGLILDGRLYSGTSDLAGEVGHVRLAEGGPVGFGKDGSFEGFCSGGGIARLAQAKAKEILQAGRTTLFCSSAEELHNIDAKKVAEAAYAGDPVAADIYKTCAYYLGQGIALLIDILNPEIIVLGSIYARAQSLLEPEMRRVLEEETIGDSYKACKIMPAALGEQIGDFAALYLAQMINNKA